MSKYAVFSLKHKCVNSVAVRNMYLLVLVLFMKPCNFATAYMAKDQGQNENLTKVKSD
jgi:hypothetical protein